MFIAHQRAGTRTSIVPADAARQLSSDMHPRRLEDLLSGSAASSAPPEHAFSDNKKDCCPSLLI